MNNRVNKQAVEKALKQIEKLIYEQEEDIIKQFPYNMFNGSLCKLNSPHYHLKKHKDIKQYMVASASSFTSPLYQQTESPTKCTIMAEKYEDD